MCWDIEMERSALEFHARRETCVECEAEMDVSEVVWVDGVPYCEDCAVYESGEEPTPEEQAEWMMSVTFAPAVVSNAPELAF